jgi:cytoskeletal protein CcmA (bactofilin family)
MWRKPVEAKPSSESQESSSPAPAKVQAQPSKPAAADAVIVPSRNSSDISAKPATATQPAAPTAFAPTPARSSSRITSGIRIKGEISGDDDLYIDGQAEGQFRFPESRVTVGPNGRVKANIEARDIVIEGSVTGNLKASSAVQLGSSSRVQGSLMAARIAIEDGARLRGKVEMTRGGETKPDAKIEKIAPAPPTKMSATQAIARASGE